MFVQYATVHYSRDAIIILAGTLYNMVFIFFNNNNNLLLFHLVSTSAVQGVPPGSTRTDISSPFNGDSRILFFLPFTITFEDVAIIKVQLSVFVSFLIFIRFSS